jgi:hypothetical protein
VRKGNEYENEYEEICLGLAVTTMHENVVVTATADCDYDDDHDDDFQRSVSPRAVLTK